jgi:hypothetical protein
MVNKGIEEIIKDKKDIIIEFNKNDTLDQKIIKIGFSILLIYLAYNIKEELKDEKTD